MEKSEKSVYILACAHCNRIATESDLEDKAESEEPVTCSCGSSEFAAVALPESMAQEDYLVVDNT